MAPRKSQAVKAAASPPAAVAAAPINPALVSKLAEATKSGGFLYVPEHLVRQLQGLGIVEANDTMRNAAGEIAVKTNANAAAWLATNAPSEAPAAPGWGAPPPQAAPAPNGAATAPQAGFNAEGGVDVDEDEFAVEEGIPLPKIERARGAGFGPRPSIYPFEKMPLNATFHVRKTDERPEPVKTISSMVATMNAKYAQYELDANGEPIMNTRMVNRTRKNADGTPVRDGFGKVVKEAQERSTPKVIGYTKKWTVRAVGDEDHKGPGARVFRVI